MSRHISLSVGSRLAARTGFTLVELLVVIGIIALLISMLLPALNKARFSAKVVACGSNHRQIYAAMVMYANDNNGYLPGTCAVGGDYNWGSVYGVQGDGNLQSGRYPWEPSSLPAWAGVKWFGIGQLLEGKYLPPNRVVTCTDFYTTKSNSFEKFDGFDLPELYDKLMNGEYAFISGSYVLNTYPYYSSDTSNRARGKIGKPGRSGGWWNPPGPPVPHITAYIMCLSGVQRGSSVHNGYSATITHERKGVNVTYIDGHVVYQPIPESVWISFLWSNSHVSTAGDCNGTRGFWPWASLME